MTAKKGGRPKLPLSMQRRCTIRARVTSSEQVAIGEMADEFGMNVSDYVVTSCFAMAGRKSLLETKREADVVYEEHHPEGSDELYNEAVKVCVENGGVSISNIQRVLGIGSDRALAIMKDMERRGFCGPARADGGKRKITRRKPKKEGE